ncbi:PQQ-dependent sugar dehydrogenase [Salinisphaera sp. SPP-AMP-43]|uniref:PQQ-dependent sugar dehydrogenase n=1 Tax=Salinisphaera sp. SPP-AMP-43 TaxID=3121288 RepID=UPI003C6E92D3
MARRLNRVLIHAGLAALAACGAGSAAAACNAAGLDLPPHFCATVFARDARQPRHIAVAADGTVYANLNRGDKKHDLMALTDTDGNGVADRRRLFGDGGATGLVIRNGWLYTASETTIQRYRLAPGAMPTGPGQTIVTGLPRRQAHTSRGLALDTAGHLYVSIGAPSNACQKADRERGSPGRKPCPQLGRHGGVWRFAANRPEQPFRRAARFATGIRNMFALTYDDARQQLIGAQMGRDQLDSLWPNQFSSQDNQRLPAEVLLDVQQGDDFGWPYCYYNGRRQANLLNPEYGGDGHKSGPCDRFTLPIAAYPAHWAPMAVVFYRHPAFPKRYQGGAFIAFHGSWNRSPAPQGGFRVVYQRFVDGKPSSDYQTFAGPRGFTGENVVRSPGSAAHRPAGLAIGPKGALYVSDDQGSTIYRITYGD